MAAILSLEREFAAGRQDEADFRTKMEEMTAGSLFAARQSLTAVLLPSGRVLVAGGDDGGARESLGHDPPCLRSTRRKLERSSPARRAASLTFPWARSSCCCA